MTKNLFAYLLPICFSGLRESESDAKHLAIILTPDPEFPNIFLELYIWY